MNRIVTLSALACAAASTAFAPVAFAQDAISTRPAQEPAQTAAIEAAASTPAAPDADRPSQSQADAARWGHEVLDRAAGKLPPSDDRVGDERLAQGGDAKGKGCVRNPDRAPHGSVGVAAGSGGYRSTDIFVTQPVGDCSQVSVGFSTSRGGGWGRRGF